ncbi:MAG: PucR family transcriptional regulator ligand-binding domain-containing protein [Chloroflexota bacterium]
MLTIAEALKLSVFSSSKLVAGKSGIKNEINWVHIVDIPDAIYSYERQGVLLLTAGFGLRDNPEQQASLIPMLNELGFAGMVLSIGYCFDRTPDVMLDTANQLGFPIIESPRELLFIDITESILERIVNRQYVLLQESNKIYDELTDLVLQGKDLNALAGTLSNFLKRSITIEDPTFKVLATAQFGPIDTAREHTNANRRTPPEMARHLLDSGIYNKLLQQMGPLRVEPIPELGMTMERFVAPIIVDRQIHGYIWIIASGRPLTELDELAISHGATVAALFMFKEQAVHEAEEALRGDFFEQLMRGNERTTTFQEMARRFGYRLTAKHQILLIQATLKAGGNLRFLETQIHNWLRENHITSAFLVWRNDFLVLVTESVNDDSGKQLADRLVKNLNYPASRLLIGVGSSFEHGAGGGIRQSYTEAKEAVDIGEAFDKKEGVVAFHELGLLHWLYRLPREAYDGNHFLKYIDQLKKHDKVKQGSLTKTLESYLDFGGALTETSQALYIHRNTLLRRLERIQEICDLDLRDPQIRINLHIALKGHYLQKRV